MLVAPTSAREEDVRDGRMILCGLERARELHRVNVSCVINCNSSLTLAVASNLSSRFIASAN